MTIWHVVGLAISFPLYAALKYGLRKAVDRWRTSRLDQRITHAQGELHAAIARGDRAGDAMWSKRITRLMAKRRAC